VSAPQEIDPYKNGGWDFGMSSKFINVVTSTFNNSPASFININV
jgi:hypothetical protein